MIYKTKYRNLTNFDKFYLQRHDRRHKKPVICQDSDELLDFIFGPEEK